MGAYGGAVATYTGQETESRPVNSHPQVYSAATVYFSMEWDGESAINGERNVVRLMQSS